MRLELEPARKVVTRLLHRLLGVLVWDDLEFAGSLSDQLHLATALERNKPPCGGIDGISHGDEPVILVDQGLAITERGGEARSILSTRDDCAAGIGVKGDIAIEHAMVLADHLELLTEGRKRLAVDRVRVECGNHVWPGFVDGVVNREGGGIDGLAAVHDRSGRINQDEIAHLHLLETRAKRIHPEVVGELWVSRRHVTGNAFGKTEVADDSQRPSEALLAMLPLGFHRIERLRQVELEVFLLRLEIGFGENGLGIVGRRHISSFTSSKSRCAPRPLTSLVEMSTEIEEPFAAVPRIPARRGTQSPSQPFVATPEDGLLELTGLNLDGDIIDLAGVEQLDIEDCDLRRVSFESVEGLTEIRVAQSVIEHTDLSRLRLRTVRQSRLLDAKLVGTDLSDGLVQDTVFLRCVLRIANLRMATFKRVAFTECQMVEVDAYRASLQHISFTESHIAQLNVDAAEAERVDLRGATALELSGASRLDGYLVSEAQLPALSYQLAAIVGLSIER